MSSFRRRKLDSQKAAGRKRAARRTLGEQLERRDLLTTLFVDFGEAQPIITAGDLFTVAQGPNLNMEDMNGMPVPFPPNPVLGLYANAEELRFRWLRNVIRDQGIDFDQNGTPGTLEDYEALRDSVMSILERIFEPFDVTIQEAAATTVGDVAANFGPDNVAYVFASGLLTAQGGGGMGDDPLDGTVAADRQAVTADDATDDPGVPVFGDASAIDEQAGANAENETAVVYADALAFHSQDLEYGFPLDIALANVIAREAGRTFGLLRLNTGNAPLALRNASDVMFADRPSTDAAAPLGTPNNTNLQNIGMFSRFDLNVNANTTQNSYELLLGNVNANPAFGYDVVTGTGAFDEVVIQAGAVAGMADVTVTTYRTNQFGDLANGQIGTPFTYQVSTAGGVFIDLGRSVDRVAVDALLDVEVRIRGGAADTEIAIIGDGLVDGTYTPGLAYTVVPGLGDTIDGQVDVFTGGTGTTVLASEMTDASTIFAVNYANFTFLAPVDSTLDLLSTGTITDAGGVVAINGQVTTALNGPVNTAILQFQLVENFVIDCTNSDGNDAVVVDAGGLPADFLTNFTFAAGPGADFLQIEAIDISLPGGGLFTYDGGDGVDTIATEADTDWRLTEGELFSGGGGSVVLVGLEGEVANITAGDSGNTIEITNWTGTGTINGLAGDDTIIFGNDLDPNAIEDVSGSFDVNGGDDNDTFFVNSWSGFFLNLNGDLGNDQFNFGSLSQDLDNVVSRPVVVGGDGIDKLLADDSATDEDESYDLDATQIQPNADTPHPFAGISIDGSLEEASLIATQGKSVFYVTPSQDTAFRVDGQNPAPGTFAPGGDVLVVRFPRAGGQKFIPRGKKLDGAGVWTFLHGEEPVFFSNIEQQGSIIAAAADTGQGSTPLVKGYNSTTNQLLFAFHAYPQSFKGGVRVVMADVNGDSVLDVITASGSGKVNGIAGTQVRVFDGAILASAGLATPTGFVPNANAARIGNFFVPHATSYVGGLFVAAADFDHDGRAEIITSKSSGSSKINVFTLDTGTNTFKRYATAFVPYGSNVKTGALVAAGDVDGDGNADIVTVPGPGSKVRVKTFILDPTAATPRFIAGRQFDGFETSFKNGSSVAVGDMNNDGLAEIFLGAGAGGRSRVRVFNHLGTRLREFTAFTTGKVNAPLRIAARVTSAPEAQDGEAVLLYVAQGNDGRSREIRLFDPLTGNLVDKVIDTDPAFAPGIWMG